MEPEDEGIIECICSGCGKKHVMKMRWIGKGMPREYCQNCRGTM